MITILIILKLFIFLILMQFKHWWIDFVNQTREEVISKGKYGDRLGLYHSLKHGLFTGVISILFISDGSLIFGLVVIDLLLHYHIDWTKRNYGCQDINSIKFWHHMGFDQMIHQLTYLGYTYILFIYLIK
jgi:hypothetical protein